MVRCMKTSDIDDGAGCGWQQLVAGLNGCGLAGSAAVTAPAHPCRDGVKPGGWIGTPLELAPLAKCLEQRVLKDILGFDGVAAEGFRRSVELRRKPLGDFLKVLRGCVEAGLSGQPSL